MAESDTPPGVRMGLGPSLRILAQFLPPALPPGRLVFFSLAVVSTISLALTGCSRGFGGRDRPNLLLISIDSLRADCTDGFGSPLPTGPRVRRLAQEGVIFRSATAAAPWTTPSMMTVLTGLYPWSHHVRDHDFSLSPQVPLLSQRLKEAGYATAAIVPSATLGEDYGFARGFDLYVIGYYGHQEVTSPAMAGQALSWLDRQGGPFFCWIHLWDPHFNYLPPHPYDASFPSDFRPAENRYQLAELKNHESPLRLEEVRFLESQYEGEIL